MWCILSSTFKISVYLPFNTLTNKYFSDWQESLWLYFLAAAQTITYNCRQVFLLSQPASPPGCRLSTPHVFVAAAVSGSDDGLVEFVPSAPLSRILADHRTIHKYLAQTQADPQGGRRVEAATQPEEQVARVLFWCWCA